MTIGFTNDRGNRVARVFSNALDRDGEPYAKHVIKGTKPHPIIGRAGGGRVSFQWTKEGNRWAVFPRGIKRHPGNAPNNFLRDALNAAYR